MAARRRTRPPPQPPATPATRSGTSNARKNASSTSTTSPSDRLVIWMRFKDYTGKTVLHCHILNHEDRGMMAVLDIEK
ncbi:multicopper oxidase domain-containing protein [Streptomyces sp. 900105755]